MPQARKNRFIVEIYSLLARGIGEMHSCSNNLKIGIGIALMIFWFIYLGAANIVLSLTCISPFLCLFSLFDAYGDVEKFNVKAEPNEKSHFLRMYSSRGGKPGGVAWSN